MSETKFAKRMKTIKVPKGFTAQLERKRLGYSTEEHEVFTLVKPDDTKIEFWAGGVGSTEFVKEPNKGGDSWLTFDRRGVEASFYHEPFGDWDKEVYDLNKIVKEQLKRIKEQRKYYQDALQVPGIPFTVSPKELEVMKVKLRRGDFVNFMPGGFGTGYVISTSVRNLHGTKRATKEMETFFGVSSLFISPIECD